MRDQFTHTNVFFSWPVFTGWWFGTFWIFPYIGNFIIPTDELIIFRGVGLNHQPVISCFINMLVISLLLLDGRDCIRNSDGAIGIPSSFMCIFVPCLMIIVLLKMFIRIIWVICFKMLLCNMAHLVTFSSSPPFCAHPLLVMINIRIYYNPMYPHVCWLIPAIRYPDHFL